MVRKRQEQNVALAVHALGDAEHCAPKRGGRRKRVLIEVTPVVREDDAATVGVITFVHALSRQFYFLREYPLLSKAGEADKVHARLRSRSGAHGVQRRVYPLGL